MITAPQSDYRVVIADPPWSYSNSGCNGSAQKHYQTQSDEWIKALPVSGICADDSVLFLWATWPKLNVAFNVIDSWGFKYVTGFPWVKVNEVSDDLFGELKFSMNYGVGFWVRGASEPLLIAKRGKASMRSNYIGLLSPNLEHSRKPESVYSIAELHDGPRIELFARRSREGWDAWGNEIDGRAL